MFDVTRTALAALALLAPIAAAADDLPKEEFAIRESVPQTGTSIRKNVTWGSSIPINRTYAQLTAAQKRLVHSRYERIDEGDEPPFPAEGLKPILYSIWRGQSQYLAKGNLTLVATVDSTGKVEKVDAYEVPDPDLTKYAASVLLLTKFKPAVCKGTVCRMQFPLSFVLNVE